MVIIETLESESSCSKTLNRINHDRPWQMELYWERHGRQPLLPLYAVLTVQMWVALPWSIPVDNTTNRRPVVYAREMTSAYPPATHWHDERAWVSKASTHACQPVARRLLRRTRPTTVYTLARRGSKYCQRRTESPPYAREWENACTRRMPARRIHWVIDARDDRTRTHMRHCRRPTNDDNQSV